ncbi:MAG: hypothetical protein WCP11_01825 [Candidatus Saccharibacteria bacterium]
MAKIISTSTDTGVGNISYSAWKIAIIGAALGAIFWGLVVVGRVFLPLATASNIATVAVAVIGVALMLLMRMPQPLITAVAAAAALWGLAVWSDGLSWAEIVVWSVALYCLSYVMFSWIARYAKVVPVLLFVTIVIILARVAISL